MSNRIGAYITLAGIALFTIGVCFDWLSADSDDAEQVDGPSVSGDETDSLIPLIAYLGTGPAAPVGGRVRPVRLGDRGR